METKIKGRKAIICASTQGLGFACAQALAAEGCEIIINGRDASKLTSAIAQLRSEFPGCVVNGVAADINTEQGRAALIAACPDPDILINNNAGPPPGKLEDWDYSAWMKALESNLLAAALLMRDVIPGMRARKFGRIVNITSAMVKSPHPLMGLSTAARAGLTALSKSLSRDVIVDNVTINNMLPERFDTPRQEFMAKNMMIEQGITRDEARRQIVATIPAGRLGQPEEFGAACVFLCSAHAGFITGQNLQLDGGAYHGLI
jgi:3-oxoacyl-[acyl-carrier protein] reductase